MDDLQKTTIRMHRVNFFSTLTAKEMMRKITNTLILKGARKSHRRAIHIRVMTQEVYLIIDV